MHIVPSDAEVFAIERPHPSLLKYYGLRSLGAGPAFFFVFLPLYFRYRSLRYRFDAEGIAMRWGVLFRREINLTYARIQDIHLTSNVVERWLGLAKVQIQTASGSSSAEMTIVGLRQFESVRDFLYTKMRGLREVPSPAGGAALVETPATDLASTLRAVAAELRALRLALGERDTRS